MKYFRGQQFSVIVEGGGGQLSLRRLCLLLLVEDDADDVALVLLHVLHQTLLAGGLEAADTAAEQEDAVLHPRAGARGGGLTGTLLQQSGVLPLGAQGFTGPL